MSFELSPPPDASFFTRRRGRTLDEEIAQDAAFIEQTTAGIIDGSIVAEYSGRMVVDGVEGFGDPTSLQLAILQAEELKDKE